MEKNARHPHYNKMACLLYRIVNGDMDGMMTVGMVEDGTKCADGMFCLNHSCVAVSQHSFPLCPVGENNITCSGNGVSWFEGITITLNDSLLN